MARSPKPSGKKSRRVQTGEEAAALARSKGWRVEECPGSHFKLASPDGREKMTCVHGELSTGVSCVVTKWLMRAGLLAIIFASVYLGIFCA